MSIAKKLKSKPKVNHIALRIDEDRYEKIERFREQYQTTKSQLVLVAIDELILKLEKQHDRKKNNQT